MSSFGLPVAGVHRRNSKRGPVTTGVLLYQLIDLIVLEKSYSRSVAAKNLHYAFGGP
jgi:hypothetical protein